jgi:hypothetical protein
VQSFSGDGDRFIEMGQLIRFHTLIVNRQVCTTPPWGPL